MVNTIIENSKSYTFDDTFSQFTLTDKNKNISFFINDFRCIVTSSNIDFENEYEHDKVIFVIEKGTFFYQTFNRFIGKEKELIFEDVFTISPEISQINFVKKDNYIEIIMESNIKSKMNRKDVSIVFRNNIDYSFENLEYKFQRLNYDFSSICKINQPKKLLAQKKYSKNKIKTKI